MNIETVNELIQSLESAGELSIKERKYLELAKAYVQLAAENVARQEFVKICFRAVAEGASMDGADIQEIGERLGLFGVNTPDLPPLDGESRTVTVKLPEVRITVAEALRRKMTYRELDAYNAGALASVEKIQAGQTDAGIKWEAE